MRIERNPIQPVPESYRTQPAKPVEAAGGPAKTDEVTLSPQAAELQKARAAYDALPDIRADRVAELRNKIQGGTYKVDAGRIADAIVFGQTREVVETQE